MTRRSNTKAGQERFFITAPPLDKGARGILGQPGPAPSCHWSAILSGQDILQFAEEALRGGAFLAGLGFAEGFQQLLLPGAQSGRGLDLDLDHHVAMAAAVEDRHAGAALAQLLAGLDAGGNVDRMLLPIEARNLDA